jgi:hypothetical protein
LAKGFPQSSQLLAVSGLNYQVPMHSRRVTYSSPGPILPRSIGVGLRLHDESRDSQSSVSSGTSTRLGIHISGLACNISRV